MSRAISHEKRSYPHMLPIILIFIFTPRYQVCQETKN